MSTTKKLDVYAVGELNVDLIMAGLSQAPVVGREILCQNTATLLGSSTAICACVMSSLGLKTGFVGHLGCDAWGDVADQTLRRHGIDTTYVLRRPEARTGLTVCMSVGNDRAMVTYMGDTIDCLTIQDLPASIPFESRHIHIGSFFLNEKLTVGLPAYLKTLKEAGLTISLDAGWQETQQWDNGLADVLPFVDVFFPNHEEVCGIAGTSDVQAAAEKVHAMMRGGVLVVKCGPKGALVRGSAEVLSREPYDAPVVDTTGAGDSFNAGFLYAWLDGKSLSDCLDYGNASGSVSVGRMGGTADCPTLEDVQRCIRNGRVD